MGSAVLVWMLPRQLSSPSIALPDFEQRLDSQRGEAAVPMDERSWSSHEADRDTLVGAMQPPAMQLGSSPR
jgi:hypothetical protein